MPTKWEEEEKKGYNAYLLGSAPLKYALTVSVKAAATGRVSCAPIVKGLGPLEEPATNESQTFFFSLKLFYFFQINVKTKIEVALKNTVQVVLD